MCVRAHTYIHRIFNPSYLDIAFFKVFINNYKKPLNYANSINKENKKSLRMATNGMIAIKQGKGYCSAEVKFNQSSKTHTCYETCV